MPHLVDTLSLIMLIRMVDYLILKLVIKPQSSLLFLHILVSLENKVMASMESNTDEDDLKETFFFQTKFLTVVF